MLTPFKTTTLSAVLALSALMSHTVAAAPKASLLWTADGMAKPECVIHDAGSGQVFVSNINGAPDDKNGKGSISALNLDGSVLDSDWIIGLNAPKGLAVSGNSLYVSDIDQLVEIDIEGRRIRNIYDGEGAKFLNDIAIDASGAVYVTDMLVDRIYRLKDGNFDVWLESPLLENPNGLIRKGDHLVLGTWGVMTDGFKTEVPGHLKTIDLDSKEITSIGKGAPIANIDGLEAYGEDSYLITDWMAGKLYLVDAEGATTQILDLGQGSADIEYLADSKTVLIPLMLKDQIAAYRLSE